MIVLLNVYICSLRKKSVPLLPGGKVKYALLAPWQIHRQTPTEIDKNGAVAKVKILLELGIL